MALDIETLKPIGTAALVGLTWAYYKYKSNVLDPTKPTPEKFELVKAAWTVVLAVVISIFYTLIGQDIDMAGLDVQIGIVAGFTTAFVEPGIKAVIRWIGDQKIGDE
jgi:hypothetical protein